MKTAKENNFFIEIIEKLKNKRDGQGIQDAIAKTGEVFGCLRIVLFDYHVYLDAFEKKYEWRGENQKENFFQKKVGKTLFANKKKGETTNFLAKITDLSSLNVMFQDEKAEKSEHVFYRYVIAQDKKVLGVVIIEREDEFPERYLQEIGMILYLISEEYGTEKKIDDLSTQNSNGLGQ